MLAQDRPFAQARGVREFALFSYRSLAADVADGRGPFLDAVVAQLPACGDAAGVRAWLRALLARTSGPAEFARALGAGQALSAQEQAR